MFCCAYLGKQPKGEHPALAGIGAELSDGVLKIKRLFSHVDTIRKRKVWFELRQGGEVVRRVQVILPALNKCDERSFFEQISLEVVA